MKFIFAPIERHKMLFVLNWYWNC